MCDAIMDGCAKVPIRGRVVLGVRTVIDDNSVMFMLTARGATTNTLHTSANRTLGPSAELVRRDMMTAYAQAAAIFVLPKRQAQPPRPVTCLPPLWP